jgi:hypothetical protein
MLPLLLVPALSAASDMACSLNGAMSGGKCACDAPWTGKNCAKLDIKPRKKQGDSKR